MVIVRKKDGTTVWKFYRKQYKKARYRKYGERVMKYNDRTFPEWHTLVPICN